MTAWIVVGQYKYEAANGNGVYLRAFTTEEKANTHCAWMQSVAEKATSSQDDWCDYGFMVLDLEVEE